MELGQDLHLWHLVKPLRGDNNIMIAFHYQQKMLITLQYIPFFKAIKLIASYDNKHTILRYDEAGFELLVFIIIIIFFISI